MYVAFIVTLKQRRVSYYKLWLIFVLGSYRRLQDFYTAHVGVKRGLMTKIDVYKLP
jgi:hypothetical protein